MVRNNIGFWDRDTNARPIEGIAESIRMNVDIE